MATSKKNFVVPREKMDFWERHENQLSREASLRRSQTSGMYCSFSKIEFLNLKRKSIFSSLATAQQTT